MEKRNFTFSMFLSPFKNIAFIKMYRKGSDVWRKEEWKRHLLLLVPLSMFLSHFKKMYRKGSVELCGLIVLFDGSI
ncbi:hypothetical protein [Emticicia agri]|uniref:Uncharacterized protein n=1 Tax=Emticicia agri TaxID=2492393 RepID=A0A4Q5M181_9BACT|nr:hypothetical protein [Emticicia agri]RYU95948.1 hypothetical protein EWM59_08605 [Emticicia agri]